MDQVEDRICDLYARGSEEADNLANDRDLDRFILTGNSIQFQEILIEIDLVEFRMRTLILSSVTLQNFSIKVQQTIGRCGVVFTL